MEEISSSGRKPYSCLLHFFRLNAVNESDHIWDQMNAPGQTLTFNPEIEWSELLCVSFPRLFAPLLFLWCVRLIVKNGKSRKEKEKKERKKYKPTLNWQGSNSHLSASCHGLQPPPPPPPFTSWATQIFWAGREIWAKPVFKEVSMSFLSFRREIFSILTWSRRVIKSS